MSKVEVCWVLTSKCNENCKYCYRFLDIKDVDYNTNEKILKKLISDGVKEITFTGGEALLYRGFTDLLKIANENGVKCKLITNGTIVANNNDIRKICNYLNSLTLSLDSVDDEINEKIGRGRQHFSNVKKVLEYLKNKNLKVTINTVVSKANIDYLEDLGNFLSNYNIYAWRIFKFTPLRETAKINKDEFAIKDDEFNSKKDLLNKFNNKFKVEYRQGDDFENKYVNIINVGDVTKTEDGVDIIIGNVLKENFNEILKNAEDNGIFINALKKIRKQELRNKIRVFVSYNNSEERRNIVNYINSLDFADVVGESADGIDSYNKIVELKPDMVFAEYQMEDMNGIDLIKKSKQTLDNKTPMFNIIGENVPFEVLKENSDSIGNNLNALLTDGSKDKVTKVLKEYKEYQEFMNN